MNRVAARALRMTSNPQKPGPPPSGTWSEYVLSDRLEGFTGHHFMDYRLVPGVVFSTRALSANKARLEDITATILKEFGINPAPGMTGIPLY